MINSEVNLIKWDFVSQSELGGTAASSPAGPVLHELFDSLHRDFLLIFQGPDDLASLDKNIALDQSLVGVLGIPFFTYWHAHDLVELLGAIVLVRQVGDPVFLCKLLVTLLGLVDLNTLQSGVLSGLFDFFDLSLSDGVQFLLPYVVMRIVNTLSGP
jgi:hypothetical protein